MPKGNEDNVIRGITLAPGNAVGPLLQFDVDPHRHEPDTVPEDASITAAVERLERALARTRDQLNELIGSSCNRFSDIVELVFRAHLLMLDDEDFSGEIQRLVSEGMAPERAVTNTIKALVEVFSEHDNQRTVEKSEDVRDLGYRLLANLPHEPPGRAFVSGRIVILTDVFPSELLRLAIDGAAGIVLVNIPLTAHLSILARSLGIPVITTCTREVLSIPNDTKVNLDGDHARLFPLDADGEDTSAAGSSAAPSIRQPFDRRFEHETKPRGIHLHASVNILADAYAARGIAEGIGLYRSEFPFIIRQGPVDEETQTRMYRHIVGLFPESQVTLRTADIGGDKLLAGATPEDNPFLGVRGIRYSLSNRPMFRTQLRAMLRAAPDTQLRIMLPMVSTVEEVRAAREELDSCIAELESEGVPHNESPRLGAMIEIPSAAIATEEIAAETDFVSIGMNDLVMYMLAVDRTNESLTDLYRTRHPVIARTVRRIVVGAQKAAVPVSVCGEAASDPLLLPFYRGIGVTAVSVSPQHLAATASLIDRLEESWCRGIAENMAQTSTMEEMDELLGEVATTLDVAGVSKPNRLRSQP
ncbi:MAG: phosphoenolpyruvate--protein phosphotransferase [Spirochaetales bacterium]